MNRTSKQVAQGLYLHHCTRCKYKWSSRKIPKYCANKSCRSPYWNKKYVLKPNDPRRKRKH